MINDFIISILGFMSFFVFNHIILTILSKRFYVRALKNHTTIARGVITPYVPAVVLIAITAVTSIWMFVLPQTKSILEAFLHGIILGVILYGFHNFFNLTLLKEHKWRLVFVDMLYGTLLIGIVSVTMFIMKNLF